MNITKTALVLIASLGIARGEVLVTDPWVRATVPNQKATGAFMELKSKGGGRLVAASSPLTKTVELHEMMMAGDTMKMREVKSIDLPDGKTVALAPGGYHVMLMDLKAQVREGDTVVLVLTFEKGDGSRETVEISAKVRALSAAPTKSSAAPAATKDCACGGGHQTTAPH